MTRHTISALLLSAVLTASITMSIGCEREISHTNVDQTSSDGDSTHKETTVTQNPDGSITKTQEKTTNNPNP